MEDSKSVFPFRLLRHDLYLTLEVLMYVEHPEVLNKLFSVSSETRSFIENNFISIRNGFINEGLIIYQLRCDLFHIEQLETLYFETLKRNIKNRIISLEVNIENGFEWTIY
jgi:hypothetical protein